MRTAFGHHPKRFLFFFSSGMEPIRASKKGAPHTTLFCQQTPRVAKDFIWYYPVLFTTLPLYVQDHTHTNHPDLRNIVAPPRTIRKWFRRLAFRILRTRAQDPCSCCCRPTPRHQDVKILLLMPWRQSQADVRCCRPTHTQRGQGWLHHSQWCVYFP